MTYQLYIGDYAYSSWSLRGWLLFEKFGIPREEILVDFSKESGVAAQIAEIAPARTVPAMVTPEGTVVAESLAMTEELASRHPEAGIWPTSPAARAVARSLASEMHAGFTDLRNDCPMNLRVSYSDSDPRPEVHADLARIETIWDWARDTCQPEGPWLCGDFCAADAFFAPVAARIAGYNLPVSAAAMAYVMAHLTDPAFQKWRKLGLNHGATLPWYKKDYPTRPWPTA